MERKGQITIIVILGLVVLIGVGMYLTLMADTAQQQDVDDVAREFSSSDSAESMVSSVVESCTSKAIVDAIPKAAASSFFATGSENPGGDYPYYYFTQRSLLPSRNEVFSQYSSMIRDDVISCVDNFSMIRDKVSGELSYDPETLSVDVTFSTQEIIGVVDHGAFVKTSSGAQKLPSVRASVDSRLGKLYKAAEMTVYPPDYDEDEQLFTYPAFSYLEDNDLNFNVYVSDPCRQMNFVLRDDQPLSADDDLVVTYRFHGSCNS
mgnify:CR=1 FL=1